MESDIEERKDKKQDFDKNEADKIGRSHTTKSLYGINSEITSPGDFPVRQKTVDSKIRKQLTTHALMSTSTMRESILNVVYEEQS